MEKKLRELVEELVDEVNGSNAPDGLNGYLDYLTKYNERLEELGVEKKFETSPTSDYSLDGKYLG